MALSVSFVYRSSPVVSAGPEGEVARFLQALASSVEAVGGLQRREVLLRELADLVNRTRVGPDLVATLRSGDPAKIAALLRTMAHNEVFEALLADLPGREVAAPTPSVAHPLFRRGLSLGRGDLGQLARWVADEVRAAVDGTGSEVKVASYLPSDFVGEAHRSVNDFLAFLSARFSPPLRARLAEYGAPPDYWNEKFFSRVASSLATHRAVLMLLGLPVEDNWLDVELRLGRPLLRGPNAMGALRNRSFLTTATDDGDVAIGLALMERSFGASGLVGIGIDVTEAGRATRVTSRHHAFAEAAYKAVFRAHRVRRFAPGMYRQVETRDDGSAWILGPMAAAARRLRHEPESDEPLAVTARTTQIGRAVATVVLVPDSPPHILPLAPALAAVGRWGLLDRGRVNTASRMFRSLRLEPLERYIEAVLEIAGRDPTATARRGVGEIASTPAGLATVRDGLSLLYLIGLGWDEIDRVVPGSEALYRGHIEILDSGYPVGNLFGYPWHEKFRALSVVTPSFQAVMAPAAGQIWLDPMAGTAVEIVELARRLPNAHYIAMDANPENLVAAAVNVDRVGLPHGTVTLLPHDAHTPMPLPDGTADRGVDRVILTNNSTFGFTPEQLFRFFSELLRVMRSGGRIWLDAIPYPYRRWLDEVVTALLKAAGARGISLRTIPLASPDLNAAVYEVVKP